MRTELKLIRVKNHLTQKEIAERLDITQTTYLAIEKGRRRGSEEFWINLQREFNIPDEKMYSLMKLDEQGATKWEQKNVKFKWD